MKAHFYAMVAAAFLVSCANVPGTPGQELGVAETIPLPPANTDYSDRKYAKKRDAKRAALHFDKILTPSNSPDVINIYVDAYGTIYPESGYGDFDSNTAQKTLARYGGDIAWALREDRSELCQKAQGGDVEEMCEIEDEGWQGLQDKYWKKKAKEILAAFKESDKRPNTLVLMVHGFNVSDPRQQYHGAIDKIKSRENNAREYIYSQLFWDGTRTEAKRPLAKWKKAQFSGPIVGFELRRLFNAIEDVTREAGSELPEVTVMTHSSGAFVIGATLGNPVSALESLDTSDPKNNRRSDVDDFYRSFKANADATTGRWKVPTKFDLTLAMVAPATSSWTFTGFISDEKISALPVSYAEAIDGTGKGIFDFARGFQIPKARIITTVTSSDVVIGKGILRPEAFGATNLGALESSYCELEAWSKNRGLGIEIFGLNFEPTQADRQRDQPVPGDTHSWLNYLSQDAGVELIDLMLGKENNSDFEISC